MPYIVLLASLGLSYYAVREDLRANKSSSRRLWIPLAWFYLVASKPLSLWLNPQSSAVAGGTVNTVAWAVLIILGVRALAQRAGRFGPVISANTWLAILFLLCLVSLAWSNAFDLAINSFIKQLGHLVMVGVILTEDKPQEALVSLLKRAAYILVPLCVTLFTHFPGIGIRYQAWTGEPNYVGAMFGKNAMASFGTLAVILFFWELAYGRQHRERKWVDLTMLVLALYVLRMGRSDGQWMCVLFAAAIILTARYAMLGKSVRRGLTISAYVLMISVSAQAILGVSGMVVEFLRSSETFDGRIGLWVMLRSTVPNDLFGAGFDSFWTPYQMRLIAEDYWWTPNQAHNGYLEVFLNLGFVGLAIFLGLITSTFRRIGKMIENGDRLGILFLCFAISFVLTNLTEAMVFGMIGTWFLFLLTTASASLTAAQLASVPVRPAADTPESTPSDAPRWPRDPRNRLGSPGALVGTPSLHR